MQQIQQYFEPALLKHDDFLSKYEPKVFSVLGKDVNTNTKEIALRGIATMKKELDALIEDRKQRTNIFRLIVNQFTEREKKAQDLIDSLQNKANVCLEAERKSIEAANELIHDKIEKEIEEVQLDKTIPDDVKKIAAAELEAKASVEILDQAKSRVKYELKFQNQLGVIALILWYITTDECVNLDLDKAEKISVSNMITLAKKYHKESGLMLNNCEFIKVEIAK